MFRTSFGAALLIAIGCDSNSVTQPNSSSGALTPAEAEEEAPYQDWVVVDPSTLPAIRNLEITITTAPVDTSKFVVLPSSNNDLTGNCARPEDRDSEQIRKAITKAFPPQEPAKRTSPVSHAARINAMPASDLEPDERKDADADAQDDQQVPSEDNADVPSSDQPNGE